MRDTVELLESIGRDAHLRHASPEELAKALEAAGASAGVREFAAHGDSAGLADELGLKHHHVEHHSQTGGHEGDGDDHDPHHHPHPDQDDEGDKPKRAPDNPDESSPT
jgi:hypothetical protein